ncbi:Cytosolic seryl-tRNA synthetase, partial [Coemansia aciculifera]
RGSPSRVSTCGLWLVSCSNCTDYQSRNLEIRCGTKKMGDREKKYVHCLNSTLCATERALCCLVENYQTPEGLRILEVLIPFMGGVDFIPYVKDTIPKHMKQ